MTETAASAPEGTAAHYFVFLEWAALKGELPKSMTNNWAGAARSVFAIDDQPLEDINVIGIDLDSYFARFETLSRTKYSNSSMNAYKSRFRTGITSYRAWLAKEPDWKPLAASPSKAARRDSSHAGTFASKPAPTHGSSTSPRATSSRRSGTVVAEPAIPDPGMIDYPFPIRPGTQARLLLPEDMTVTEARRISAFVTSLALPDGAQLQIEGRVER